MHAGYRLYIFDLDGTVVDSRESIGHAFASLARSLDLNISTDLGDLHIGLALDEIFAQLNIDDIPAAREIYRTCYYQNVHRETSFPGISQILDSLRPHAHLAIATNKGARGARASLAASGLENIFDTIQAADTAEPKPASGQFDNIRTFYRIHHAPIMPWQCLMIGDSPVDIEFARTAGMDSAFVSWGFYPQKSVSHTPTHMVSSPAELLRLQPTRR